MMRMTVETEYEVFENCFFVLGEYLRDGSLAIQICSEEDGLVAVLTKCIDHDGLALNESETFVDINNCPFAADLIKKYELGTFTGVFRRNGFCNYPLYKFNMEQLEKYEE